MTREEIIQLAREAGFSVSWPETVPNFERFAALVAAAEREACAAFLDEYAKRDQSIAERQALEGYFDLSARTLGILLLSEKCLVEFLADKIRARGEE